MDDHQANGIAECAVREIKRQVRVLRDDLDGAPWRSAGRRSPHSELVAYSGQQV